MRGGRGEGKDDHGKLFVSLKCELDFLVSHGLSVIANAKRRIRMPWGGGRQCYFSLHLALSVWHYGKLGQTR